MAAVHKTPNSEDLTKEYFAGERKSKLRTKKRRAEKEYLTHFQDKGNHLKRPCAEE